MAVPAFVGSNIQDTGSGLSLTFDLSAAGASSGHFMVVFVKQSENTTQRIWDDDGGGGNGWVREAYNRTTGGRDQETAVYWKFHDGSESDPTFTWASGITAEPMSGSLLVYSGVDTVTPFTQLTFSQAQNDANPPNPIVRIDFLNTRVICFHAATHDDISSVAAPTGFSLRTQVWSGTANDHRNHFTADIEIDTLGSYSPPDWQHSVLNTTPEYHTYSLALNEVQPIHITGGTLLDGFLWGASGLTVTGDGFEAIKGAGKVEFWSDVSGTIKTIQTDTTWSDVSITVNTVQGSLGNDTQVYLVVTNDSGDESGPIPVNVGVLPYDESLLALSPDHYWRLDNNYNDTGVTGPVRNMTSGVVGTWSFNTEEISDGNTHSLNYNSVTDRREIVDSANMNITINSDERTVACWFKTNVTQHALAAIWKEGGGVQNLAILMGYGGVILFQLADVAATRDNAQAWSDIKLTPGRAYHLCLRYTDTEFSGFIDGEEVSNTDGNPLTIGTFDSHSGDVVWNNPDNNLETGGTDIAYLGCENAQISDFATWSDNSSGDNAGALDKITEIRDILFRRGAVPDDVISSGTEAAMQIAFDGTLDSRVDSPLSYRIEGVSGGGSFELVANDKVFDDRITLHLEYRGSDTLTIVRPSSSNFDEAKTFSVTGGTIEVIDLVDLVITVRDFNTKSIIEGARVRMTASNGGPETEGAVLLEGVTNASGQLTGTYRFSSSQPVDGKIRKSSTSPLYKTSPIAGTIELTGLSLTVFMIPDE